MNLPLAQQVRPLAGLAAGARIFSALLGALLLGACENSGVSSGFPAGAEAPGEVAPTVSYRLVAADPAAGTVVAQQREAIGVVRAALAAKGLYEAAREAVPDVVVRFDSQLGPPHNGTVRETEPIYDVTPGKEIDASVAVGIGGNGGTVYEMRKVKEPDVVIYQGERPISVIRRVYEKRLRLSARANHGPAGRELWSLELIAEGQRRDFRKMLPVLAGPGRAYLGNESDGPTVLRLNDDTGAIESVERAL